MTDPVEAWRSRHPGVEASGPVRLWLRSLDPLARRAAGVDPDVLTALGVAAALGAVVVSRRTGAALLVVGGVLDGLDGMVAGGPSERGERLDHTADRMSDACLAAALARAGAPRWLAAAALAAVLGQESARRGSVVVTPGERPTRIALGVLGVLGFPRFAAAGLTAVCGASWALLAADWRRSRPT